MNTRLQVEHPVSEEVTGLDLVREMFRIAAGEPLGYDDPVTRGHSFEFRINAEDAGRSFMPAPGTLTGWRPPSGPGVRVDEGYLAGMTVPSAYDSLVAKIIVTGADRDRALQRSRRALAETVLEGMPSVLPFHRAVLDEPAFTAPDGVFGVHTRWIETEFGTQIAPYSGPEETAAAIERQSFVVEVDGRRLQVRLPADLVGPARKPQAQPSRPARRGASAKPRAAASADLTAPMQGTIVTVAVAEGDEVNEGDLVVVLEAMKMEQPIVAHRSGMVRNLRAEPGATVTSGAVLCSIEPAS